MKISACVYALVLLSPAAAVAQDAAFSTLPLMNSHNELVSEELRRNFPSQRQTASRPSAARVTPTARAVATTYRSTPAVSLRVREQFMDWIDQQNASEGAKVRQIFDQNDPIQIWSGIARLDGLRTGDVADAFTSYWLLNWIIANQANDNTPAQARAVRDQVRGLIGSSPAFQGLDEAERQEMAEVYMLNFVVQQGGYTSAMREGNRAIMAQASDAAQARFRNEMGVDLRQISLTDRGFVAAD